MFYALGASLLIVGIYAAVRRKFEVMKRIGLMVTGLLCLVLAFISSKSRIELYDDRIVQHIQSIPPERTEVNLDGITRVTALSFEDAGKDKESWLFFRGEEQIDSVMATGVWKHNSDAIVEFLGTKGIQVTRQKSK